MIMTLTKHQRQHGIKCGACKDRHGTADEVRDCYQWKRDAEWEMKLDAGYERWLENRGSDLDPAGYAHDRMMEAMDPGLNRL
jgi:hypothetical protein